MADIIFHHGTNRGGNLDLGQVSSAGSELIFQNGELSIINGESEERPDVVSIEGEVLVIFGSPVYKNQPLHKLSRAQWSKVFRDELKSLDSSFLIFWISHGGREAKIISDRFGSIGIFWWSARGITAFSTEFRNSVKQHRRLFSQKLDTQSIFEFLWFRRLFGDVSYIEGIRWLPGGRLLEIQDARVKSFSHYWSPVPRESHLAERENSEKLRAVATSAIDRALEAGGRHGLMLSGGLDSRCLLGVGRDRYTSFTTAPRNNNESQVAAELASVAGSRHHFIPRPGNYLDIIFDQAMGLSNGMTQYYECQFLGYRDFLGEHVDNIHIGLFWDIFFCGHYMPKFQRTFFGRNTLYFSAINIERCDMARFFVHNISYRQKTTDLAKVIPRQVYCSLIERQYDRVRERIAEGSDLGFSGVDLWEYMHLTDLGRHYSMLMARSLRPFIRVQIPALTNESYQLAFALSAQQKINWSTYLSFLNVMCPDLMGIRNSNTNIRASRGLYSQTAIKFMKGIQKNLTGSQSIVSPSIEDRSWPTVQEPFLQESRIASEMEQLFQIGKIWDLGLFDRSAVRELYDRNRSGRENHSIFLSQLMTLEHGLLAHL